jgi:hypothetical protein
MSDPRELDEVEEFDASAPDLGAEVIDLNTTVDPLLSQWARFRDGFAKAIEGFWTIEDLEARIANRRAFFFPGREAAVVAQIQSYPDGSKVFQALWVTGNMEELVSMVPGIEAVARMMGCTDALIEGSAGWKRALEPFGFKLWSVTLHKKL